MMQARRVVVAATVVALALLAEPARADSGGVAPTRQGWWWRGTPGQLPVRLDVAKPNVPENGLFVAGDLTGDEAISALRFDLTEGATPTALTLQVAGEVQGTAIVRLCSVTGPWQSAQQGAWDKRPEYKCADKAPVGTLSNDRTELTFPLAGAGAGQSLEVALVPGVDERGARTAFRVAFQPPAGSTLQVTVADRVAAPVPGDEPLTALEPPAADAGTSAPSVGLGLSASAPEPLLGGDGLPPTTAVVAAAGPGGARRALVAPGAALANPAAIGAPARDDLDTIAMLGLIVVAALYVRLGGQGERQPKSLVVFGKGAIRPGAREELR